MASLAEKIQQMVNNRCLSALQQGSNRGLTESESSVSSQHSGSAEVDLQDFDILDGVDDLDFSLFMSEEFINPFETGQKRKTLRYANDYGSDQSYSDSDKRLKRDIYSPAESYTTEQSGFDLPHVFHPDTFSVPDNMTLCASCDSELDNNTPRPYQASVFSEESSPVSPHSSVLGSVEGENLSAEYHFEQIQKHAQLAIAALRRGQYEHNKNIVTWAHELKNKTAHEVKREAEAVWETDKDKVDPALLKAVVKKPVIGSTKRVEQFRKNLRRWMTGTQVHQVGVEWMVYARMEHLQAIASFILGDALPDDPASSTAVAESISKYLGLEVPSEFVDSQLAEPEPGKRYVIGQALIPYLQSRNFRKVPTLAFTMPNDNDYASLNSWLTSLRALFPKKPAPKPKMVKP